MRCLSILVCLLFLDRTCGQPYDVKPAEPNKPLLNSNKKFVWVAAEGFKPLQKPEKDSEASKAPPLKYMEMCGIADDYQSDSGGNYVLLTKGTPGESSFHHLGWIPKSWCVLKPDCLTTPNKIQRKAMVVNTVESLGKTQVIDVPVRTAPFEHAGTRSSFALFNIYFIYAETGNDTDGYYLLGATPQFDTIRAAENPEVASRAVLGWVRKDRVCEWDTREALEWNVESTLIGAPNRRTQVGRAYRTFQDAKNALTNPNIKPLFEEVFDDKGQSVPLPFDRMRYPKVPLNRDEEVNDGDERGGKLFRVGFVAGFVDAEGRTIATAEEIEKIQRQLRRLEEEVKLTEILFVIDSTSSMEPSFKTVANIIEQIIESVRKDPSRKVRLGVAFYNDINGTTKKTKDDAVETNPLFEADSAGAKKFIETLRQRARDGLKGGGDAREQMFHGIKRGIEDAGFSQFSRKIVILIGDMGDHDRNENKANIEEKAIVKKLISPDNDRSPIEFFAVQVIPPTTSEDAQAFADQSKTILEEARRELEKQGLMGISPGALLGTEDHDRITRAVLNRYHELIKRSRELEEEVQKLQRGQWADIKIGPELEQMLQEKGIDIERLRRSKGSQVFSYAYVWERANGVPQIRLKYLISGGELKKYLRLFQDIFNEELDTRPSNEKLAQALVGAATGDQTERQTFETTQLKSMGLVARSPLLKRTTSELVENRDTIQLFFEVRSRVGRLEDVLNDKESKWEKREKMLNNGERVFEFIRVGEKTPKDRMFYLYGDRSAKWCWIDFEKEWP